MKETAQLRRGILSRRSKVAVVGQGYVGLSLACAAADAGFQVTGIDLDRPRLDALKEGSLSVAGVSETAFRDAFASGNLSFSSDPSASGDADFVFICVPTPVRDHTPDLTYIEEASSQVAASLHRGTMVILESTTYPGTTEEIVRPRLEASGLRCGADFLLAYSPERIDPGNQEYDFRSIPRVLGGVTPEATGLAALLYGQLVDKVFVLPSCRAAELVKLLENTFRHVNIALVNELAMMCHEMNIDVWEVIDAAASKPFGFMPFYPGPGVGGHCIPVDPTYLAWQVRRDAGHALRILAEAEDVNAQMPSYVAARIGEALNSVGKPVKGSTIVVLGVTYKSDIADVRGSPALAVMGHLLRKGAQVLFHDPYVTDVTVEHQMLHRTELTKRAIASADCVTLLTPHAVYDLEWLSSNAALLFDGRNAYAGHTLPNLVRL